MGLTFEQTKLAVKAAVAAKKTILIQGPPGVGKSSLIRDVGDSLDLPVHELIASNCDAVDIAGLPYVSQGVLKRALLPEILACVEQPGILFLDELTAVPASVQGPLMRLLLERVAGGTRLHKDSTVVAACNRPEECPGGVELSAATINRMIKIVDFAPSLDEIRGFFHNVVGQEEENEILIGEARDFAATLSVQPDLVTMSPPKVAIDAGAPFGSPRAWETGLRVFAAHGAVEDDVGFALLDGAVGQHAAATFTGIRKMRKHLPSVDQVCEDPTKAPVPEKKDHQIAAIGLLARVADKDGWAAWVYAHRITSEIGIAAGRILMTRPQPGPSKWAAIGRKLQIDLLSKVSAKLGLSK